MEREFGQSEHNFSPEGVHWGPGDNANTYWAPGEGKENAHAEDRERWQGVVEWLVFRWAGSGRQGGQRVLRATGRSAMSRVPGGLIGGQVCTRRRAVSCGKGWKWPEAGRWRGTRDLLKLFTGIP